MRQEPLKRAPVAGDLLEDVRGDLDRRIVQEIRVPFNRPRREDMKTDPSFLALRRKIWQMLKQGVLVRDPRQAS